MGCREFVFDIVPAPFYGRVTYIASAWNGLIARFLLEGTYGNRLLLELSALGSSSKLAYLAYAQVFKDVASRNSSRISAVCGGALKSFFSSIGWAATGWFSGNILPTELYFILAPLKNKQFLGWGHSQNACISAQVFASSASFRSAQISSIFSGVR